MTKILGDLALEMQAKLANRQTLQSACRLPTCTAHAEHVVEGRVRTSHHPWSYGKGRVDRRFRLDDVTASL